MEWIIYEGDVDRNGIEKAEMSYKISEYSPSTVYTGSITINHVLWKQII